MSSGRWDDNRTYSKKNALMGFVFLIGLIVLFSWGVWSLWIQFTDPSLGKEVGVTFTCKNPVVSNSEIKVTLNMTESQILSQSMDKMCYKNEFCLAMDNTGKVTTFQDGFLGIRTATDWSCTSNYTPAILKPVDSQRIVVH